MNIVDWLLYACVGVHFYISCQQFIRLSSSRNWLLHKQRFTPKETSMSRIHILIPVYREAAVIKASVEFFDKLARYPNVLVYYVTTEKEGENSETVAALEQLSGRYAFSHLHYPQREGFKAHQLNWAIEQILAAIDSDDYQATYFGIYDVDSRPQIEVIETILHGKEPVYQQPSIYLENYSRLGPFQRAGALLQTKWELCGNIPIFRGNEQSFQENRSITSLPHCTGHGLFIRADVLKNVGLLDTRTLAEDLEFGYRYSFRGIPITVLQEADYAQFAPTFPATVLQTSRWFHGEMGLYRYYCNEKKRSNERMLRNWLFRWLVFKRYCTTLKWAFGTPLITLVFLILVIRYPANIMLVLLSAFLYVYLPFRSVRDCALWSDYTGDKQSLLALTLLGCVWSLLNSCGPFHFLLTALINRIRGRSATFVRTPKN